MNLIACSLKYEYSFCSQCGRFGRHYLSSPLPREKALAGPGPPKLFLAIITPTDQMSLNYHWQDILEPEDARRYLLLIICLLLSLIHSYSDG
jgi:hypothetical protein